MDELKVNDNVTVMADGVEKRGIVRHIAPYVVSVRDPREGLSRAVRFIVVEYDGFAHPHFDTDVMDRVAA